MPHPEIEQNVQELIFPVENLPEQEPQNFEGKLGLSQCPRLLELAEDSEFELDYKFSLKRDSRKFLIDGDDAFPVPAAGEEAELDELASETASAAEVQDDGRQQIPNHPPCVICIDV